MFAYINTLLQQPDSLMLIIVLILVFIGLLLHRIIYSWLQMPVREDKKFQDAFWEEPK